VSTAQRAGHTGRFATQFDARHDTRLVRLIIVESGSTGLAARASVEDGSQVVAIAQGDAEPVASFASRVVRRILAVERAQQSIERTVLFLGNRIEPEAAEARLTIARALITHSATARGRSPELLVDASSESCQKLRVEMPALVDALIRESANTAFRVAVTLDSRA
jgi:hypothetical protein